VSFIRVYKTQPGQCCKIEKGATMHRLGGHTCDVFDKSATKHSLGSVVSFIRVLQSTAWIVL